MSKLLQLIFITTITIKKIFYRIIILPVKKSMFIKCGKKVYIANGCTINYKNIIIGNNVSIGSNAMLMSANAKINIGNNVMLGPNVTIITGDHRIDLIGRFMIDVKEEDKLDKNDKDVFIEDDVWIGANVVILKGVKIGKGSVIGAGSLINKDVIPYAVVGGNPARIIKMRFDENQISKHEMLLKSYRS